ncbi:MAG: TIGR04283 family arsenosugar biosynthesis glycosyltransferase [Candidatus Promineifilaceae bacterium]|nr:TIGR04283 family arsenosugar biosynthesis glycosyltransferase [Candidatus Promineifilaceae bacterium]
MKGEQITFSVIVPAINEAEMIEVCVRHIRQLEPQVEVIVADGGSDDGTAGRAWAAGARVCYAPRGRGPQCNAGANLSTGDVLLFLHADTRLPANAFSLLRREFANRRLQVGTFRLTFDASHWLYDLYTFFSRFDSVFTSFGDQCIVIRRSFFSRLGGFPDWPLFEDVRLLQKARACTTVRSFPAAIVTSARRFEREGVLRQSLRNSWYVLQYLCGRAPETLAARYERRH